MNLIIDIGNTQYKVCVFDNDEVIYHTYLDELNKIFIDDLMSQYTISQAIYSDTRGVNEKLFEDMFANTVPIISLKHTTKLPVKLEYNTPETLGKDRIAGVVGAFSIFPNEPCLVIDIGTALTIDFIAENAVFKGGIISPGPEIRFRALHQFTGKLPLLKPTNEVSDLGYSTKTAIQFGVQNGLAHEINGYISRFKQQYHHLKIILTGGYAYLFDKKINYPIFADSFLVPKGLNRILVYNELQK